MYLCNLVIILNLKIFTMCIYSIAKIILLFSTYFTEYLLSGFNNLLNYNFLKYQLILKYLNQISFNFF